MKDRTKTNGRRLLILALAAAMLLLCLAGCGKDKEPDPTDPPPVQTQAPTDAPETQPPETTPPPTEPEVEKESVFATVTAEKLNVRDKPGMDSNVVEQLTKNTRVEILEQQTIDGTNWGRTAIGWINLAYVRLNTDENETTEPDTENTNIKGTIITETLNIRDGHGTDSKIVGKYKKGDRVTIVETYMDLWGRTDKGWISLKYVELDENTGEDETPEVISDGNTKAKGTLVIVTGSLNVRSGPSSSYEAFDEVSRGERYEYYQKEGNWVRISKGWIYTKDYAYIEGTTGENACTGTITADSLNVRQGPGTKFESVDELREGDTVQILEQVKVGNTTWGFTGKGWISMAYVEVKK